jgi:hypothetical protein
MAGGEIEAFCDLQAEAWGYSSRVPANLTLSSYNKIQKDTNNKTSLPNDTKDVFAHGHGRPKSLVDYENWNRNTR